MSLWNRALFRIMIPTCSIIGILSIEHKTITCPNPKLVGGCLIHTRETHKMVNKNIVPNSISTRMIKTVNSHFRRHLETIIIKIFAVQNNPSSTIKALLLIANLI